MALQTKDFSASGVSASGTITYTYILRVTENSTDPSKNTSNITVQAILKQTYSGTAFYQWTTYYSCTINGNEIFSANAQKALSGTSEHVYHTWTGDIEHDSNGELTITVGGQLRQREPENYSPPTITINENSNDVMVLTSIPVVTECKAPTEFFASSALFEGSIELRWSGAQSGQNNPIFGYAIYAAHSRHGYDYGDYHHVWTGMPQQEVKSVILTTEHLEQHGVSIPRGECVIFWIQTIGTADAAYHSEWRKSDAVMRNSVPAPPTGPEVDRNTFRKGERVTVYWVGAYDPDYNLEKFVLEYMNDASEWRPVTECEADQMSLSFIPSEISNQERLSLRMYSVDALGAVSDFVVLSPLLLVDDPGASIFVNVWDSYSPTITAKLSVDRYVPEIYVGGIWVKHPGAR